MGYFAFDRFPDNKMRNSAPIDTQEARENGFQLFGILEYILCLPF